MFGCAASGRIAESSSKVTASSISIRTRTPRSAAARKPSSRSLPVSSWRSRKYCTSSVRSARRASDRRSAKLSVPSTTRRNPDRPARALAARLDLASERRPLGTRECRRLGLRRVETGRQRSARRDAAAGRGGQHEPLHRCASCTRAGHAADIVGRSSRQSRRTGPPRSRGDCGASAMRNAGGDVSSACAPALLPAPSGRPSRRPCPRLARCCTRSAKPIRATAPRAAERFSQS